MTLQLDVTPKAKVHVYGPGATDFVQLTQPLTLAAAMKPGESVTITGVFGYQACDDTMCYAPASAPVAWTVKADEKRRNSPMRGQESSTLRRQPA
jgi:hypothetical protein